MNVYEKHRKIKRKKKQTIQIKSDIQKATSQNNDS